MSSSRPRGERRPLAGWIPGIDLIKQATFISRKYISRKLVRRFVPPRIWQLCMNAREEMYKFIFFTPIGSIRRWRLAKPAARKSIAITPEDVPPKKALGETLVRRLKNYLLLEIFRAKILYLEGFIGESWQWVLSILIFYSSCRFEDGCGTQHNKNLVWLYPSVKYVQVSHAPSFSRLRQIPLAQHCCTIQGERNHFWKL